MTDSQPVEAILGIDVGSSSIKVTAYDPAGAICAATRRPTPLVRGPDGLDFPVAALLETARETVRAAVRQAGGHNGGSAQVAAVGIASMGEVGAILRSDGRLSASTFPAWYDGRGAEVVARVRQVLGDPGGWDGRTGGHLRTTSTLAKLGWLAGRGEPMEGVFLGLAGLLAHMWTGSPWQEPSLAATSGSYDPVARAWLDEPWQAAGLGSVHRPALAPPEDHEKAVRPAAIADGIRGARIVIAGHDHPVAAVGTGAEPGSVVDSLGTGEAILAAWRGAAPSPPIAADLVAAGLTIETWPGTREPLLIREGLRPGLALQTLVRLSGMTHEELEAAKSPTRETAPFSRAHCEQAEDGDPSPLQARASAEGWPATWHALLAGYARDAALAEAELRAATGAHGPLTVTGGGIRSAAWLQAKRAATPSRVLVTNLADTGTRGAAALAGTVAGWWSRASQMPSPNLESETSVFR